MTVPKLAIIELSMDSSNLNENTLVFLYGEFLRNTGRYVPMDKISDDDMQRYEFGPDISVGDIIEDISDQEDSVIIYGDGAVHRCLEGFNQYKGRKIGVSSLDERKQDLDIDEITKNFLGSLSSEGEG